MFTINSSSDLLFIPVKKSIKCVLIIPKVFQMFPFEEQTDSPVSEPTEYSHWALSENKTDQWSSICLTVEHIQHRLLCQSECNNNEPKYVKSKKNVSR